MPENLRNMEEQDNLGESASVAVEEDDNLQIPSSDSAKPAETVPQQNENQVEILFE